jgi:hypothetical protein
MLVPRVVVLVVLTAVLSLSGCSGNPSIPVPTEPLDAVGATGPVPNQPGMVLVVRPTLHACDGPGAGAYHASVAWRVSGVPGIAPVVRIGNITGPLLAQTNGETGQVATGRWVISGLDFYLLGADNKVLASTAAPASPC